MSFQRKSLSFESALIYLQAFTRNAHAFLWKRSSLFQHFNLLCEVNGVLFHFLNTLVSEKITFLWMCIKLLTSIQKKLTCISLKEKQSVPTLQFTVNRLLLHFLNAVLSEKITFPWNCLKLLTSIHQQLTWVSLKEKHSVPTLQFTAFLWKEAVCFNTSIHCAKWMECCFTL